MYLVFTNDFIQLFVQIDEAQTAADQIPIYGGGGLTGQGKRPY